MSAGMRFLGRIFGKQSRRQRLRVRLPVLVKALSGEERQFWTEDLSEGGFGMLVPSLSDLAGGRREIDVGLVLEGAESPVQAVAEPVWSTRTARGNQFSGWRFRRFQGNGQGRVAEFLRAQSIPEP